MRLHKRILRSAGARRVTCLLAAGYIRFVHATTRWRLVGDDRLHAAIAAGTPLVMCFWHGRLLMMGSGWPYPDRIHLLISQHRDGQIIAGTIERFGFRTIAGSSTRGGSAALRAMLRALAAGDVVGITPDGPHGPRMRASAGAVSLARMAGARLMPVTWATTRRRVLGSWDRFILPLPFGRGIYMFGEPIEVPRDADPAAQDALRRELERRLTALTDEADQQCGQTTIEPAPELAPETLPDTPPDSRPAA